MSSIKPVVLQQGKHWGLMENFTSVYLSKDTLAMLITCVKLLNICIHRPVTYDINLQNFSCVEHFLHFKKLLKINLEYLNGNHNNILFQRKNCYCNGKW